MQSSENSESVDVLLGNPKKALISMSIPLIISLLISSLYNLIDAAWVSGLGADALAGFGFFTPIFMILVGFGNGLGAGSAFAISKYIGEENKPKADNASIHSILLDIIISIILTAILLVLLEPILNAMGAGQTISYATDYGNILLLGSILIILSNALYGIYRGEGDSTRPMYAIIASAILNMILDPIFIFVLGLGASGVSYATILSSGITAIYLLYWYLSGKSKVTLNFKYFKPGIVYDIFIVAIPDFLTDSLWCISMLFFNKILIAQLGQIGILLYSTASRIESIMISPQKAFGRSLISISGHLFGAGRIDDLKDLYNYVLKKAIIIALISTIIFFFIREYGFALFSVTGASTSIFYIALAAIVIIPFNEISVMSGKVLDGMGKSYHTLFLTIGIILYEIIIVTLLSPIFKQGVCVLLGILIGEITFAIIYYILLKYIFKTNGKNNIKDIIKTKKNLVETLI